jgi:membrane protein YqaA with SNARE-associated domain
MSASFLLAIPWKKIGGWLVKAKVWIILLLKPFGIWGLFGLSLVDSAAIPMPFLDLLIVSYGVNDHAKCILFCLMGALGSAVGSLLFYYLGRTGGELFLLKRVDRARYESLRDRFERQEFFVVMLPAMCPPPMPLKIFELAAGVFEMRVASFFLAIAAGKFLRFFIESVLVILYGPAILTSALHIFHRHANLSLGVVGVAGVAIAAYIARKMFDRRRPIPLPIEEQSRIERRSGDAS